MKKNLLFFLLFLSIFREAKCDGPLKKIILEGYTQNTYYRVTYFAEDTLVKKNEIDFFLHTFLQTASLWEENSVISRINRNEEVELTDDFVSIFSKALEIAEITDGAFDITVGKLVNLWGFGSKSGQEPTAAVVDSLRILTGYRKISIEGNRIIKENPGIEIDFNAIAKGYSVDLLSQLLLEKGIRSFLVDIGGEIRAGALQPGAQKWRLGIEKPSAHASSEREIENVVELSDKALATSGTYRKYREKEGRRFSHTIDPATGYPVSHTLLSASVIADECMEADALATAFMVMGLEKAILFLNENPRYDAYFIFSLPNGEMKSLCTPGFNNYLLK